MKTKSDPDREWLGRAAGWLAAAAVAWGLIAFLVFAGGYFVADCRRTCPSVRGRFGGAAGVVSGILTALLGMQLQHAGKIIAATIRVASRPSSYNIVLAVAGPIFVAVLIIALSVALDSAACLAMRSSMNIQTQPQLTPCHAAAVDN